MTKRRRERIKITVIVLRNVFYVLAVNGASIVIILYGVEWYLRSTDPFMNLPFDTGYYNSYRHRYENRITPPDDAEDYYYTWGHKVINNRFSRRERDFTTPKPAAVKRILVLGDSFTWGAGIGTSDRYSDQLDAMLNTAFPGQKWEVLNFAFSGGPTTGERDVLRSVKDTVNPDLIILGFCLNDPQPKSQDYSIEREIFMGRHRTWLDSLKKRLNSVALIYFGDLLEKAFFRAAEKLDYMPEWEEALDQTYRRSSPEWHAFVSALQDIKSISDSLGCPAPIFAALNQIGAIKIPEKLSDQNAHDPFLKLRLGWFKQARQVADSIGFAVINYDEVFTRHLRDGDLQINDLVLNPLDAHPTAKMNKIYAKTLLKEVTNMMILKPERYSKK